MLADNSSVSTGFIFLNSFMGSFQLVLTNILRSSAVITFRVVFSASYGPWYIFLHIASILFLLPFSPLATHFVFDYYQSCFSLFLLFHELFLYGLHEDFLLCVFFLWFGTSFCTMFPLLFCIFFILTYSFVYILRIDLLLFFVSSLIPIRSAFKTVFFSIRSLYLCL